MNLHSFGIMLLLMAVLAGCATSNLQTADRPLSLAGGTEITPVGAWSHIPDLGFGPNLPGKRLTRHGVLLDQVWVISGLAPGQRLISAGPDSQDGPIWPGNVSTTSVTNLLEGSLSALGYYSMACEPACLPLAPDKWSGITHFTCWTDQGLEFRGAFRYRHHDDELDLVLWMAEARVYAPRIEPDAAAMLAQLTPSASITLPANS
ncbi:MAG: hypothetical protein MRY64_07075 [Hyphomonadaceae bacterium]|nr:hypothetical protein [Hyphomonadaceae bacterium]